MTQSAIFFRSELLPFHRIPSITVPERQRVDPPRFTEPVNQNIIGRIQEKDFDGITLLFQSLENSLVLIEKFFFPGDP